MLEDLKKFFSLTLYKDDQKMLLSSVLASDSWHLKAIEDIVKELDTSTTRGLCSQTVERHLKEYGSNELGEIKPRSGLSIFVEYFKSVPVALLGVAAGLSFLTGGWIDAVVILGVVGINAVLGYVTESQSERIIYALKNLVNPSAWVCRDGELREIPTSEVVMGDLLRLKPGCYIPADTRLIEAENLTVDESTLTGESLPVLKSLQLLENEGLSLSERTNMVYRGTFVTGGQGQGIVVTVGEQTEVGKIQRLVGETSSPPTPMEKELDDVGRQLVLVSGVICGVVFALGLARGYELFEMLKTSISLAVAAVPEGLPTVATTTLALGILRMKGHSVLIRHLKAVEALGSIHTICLDKTGTLTANQMSVVEFSTDLQGIEVREGEFYCQGKFFNVKTSEAFFKLLQMGVLCSEIEIEKQDDGNYIFGGSSTEKALIDVALKAGIDVLDLRGKCPCVEVRHRSQGANVMMTVHSLGEVGGLIAVKGNPVEVLERCQGVYLQGKILGLTDDYRQFFRGENERLAGKGLRVLGVAYGEGDSNQINQDCGLIWLGLVGIMDPIREGVKPLIRQFHEAGIKTVMLTGDQCSTAVAVARELELREGEEPRVFDAQFLQELESDGLGELCARVGVFARISPAHKLQIVQKLQQSGQGVAMTGDGINDTPALKAAEVGIVMGHSGTDAAKEVADIVLEKDNLETLIEAVSQGRTIYRNIRKSLHFLLSTNLSEILVMLVANLSGWGQPLNAIQLLWLNLVTDIFPGLALGLEHPEGDVLRVPPRGSGERILKATDFKRITLESSVLSGCTLGAYGYGLLCYGMGFHAGTIAFMSLVIGQLLHAFSCRSELSLRGSHLPTNFYLNLALGVSLTLQVIPLGIPWMRGLLKITPLSFLDGVVVMVSALLPLLINEMTKSNS